MSDIQKEALKQGGRLDLNEDVAMTLSRREWATILIAIANEAHQNRPHRECLEALNDKLQEASPVGVMVRTMKAFRDEAHS